MVFGRRRRTFNYSTAHRMYLYNAPLIGHVSFSLSFSFRLFIRFCRLHEVGPRQFRVQCCITCTNLSHFRFDIWFYRMIVFVFSCCGKSYCVFCMSFVSFVCAVTAPSFHFISALPQHKREKLLSFQWNARYHPTVGTNNNITANNGRVDMAKMSTNEIIFKKSI